MPRAAIAVGLGPDLPLLLTNHPTADLGSAAGLIVIKHRHRITREQNRTVVIVSHGNLIQRFANGAPGSMMAGCFRTVEQRHRGKPWAASATTHHASP
jgi:ABC-type glutathione transport system ATPase component